MTVVLLSAPSGSGKTTACLQLTDLVRASGAKVCGIVCPAVFKGRHKCAIDMRDLSSGEQRLLARRIAPGEKATLGDWHFEHRTLAWGQHLLSHLPDAEVFILDEIGPLELLHDGGLSLGIDAARHFPAILKVLTIRPSLVLPLTERLENMSVSTIDLSGSNRNEIPRRLFEAFIRSRGRINSLPPSH